MMPVIADFEPCVSIVIPAYNEASALGLLLTQLHKVMAASGQQWEVIVVDDGSTDNTSAVAQQHGAMLLHHPTNRGYGAALKTGIRHVSRSVIVIIDGDGTYPIDSIPKLLTAFHSGQSDMVVGARIGAQVAMPFIRRPAKWIVTRLSEFVANQPIPDLNSGLRVFSRDTVLQFFDLLPDGFSFTTTITLALLCNGYLVDYVPINYYARIGRSKIQPAQDTLNFLYLILRIALFFAPLKIFLPLAGLLLTVGLTWGIFSRLVLGKLADVSTSIVVTFALETLLLGLLAELINKRTANVFRK